MLNGINEATSILLEEEEDIQKAFKSALRIIGLAIEVDRVYIFRNHENERKEMLVSQICEWTKDTVSQQIYNPELQNFSYFKNGFARWQETLSKGKAIKGKVKDFPGQERAVLKEQNILSLIVVPVIIQKNFWGFVGFDDCTMEREWEGLEEATLFNFAHSIGGILTKENNRKNLLDNQKFIQSVIDTSPNIIYVYDHQAKKIIYLSKQITDIFGFDTFEELAERNINQFYSYESDREKYKNLVLTKGDIRNHQVKAVKKDGSTVWILGSSIMVTDNEGNTCFDTAIRDITTEVIAEGDMPGGLD